MAEDNKDTKYFENIAAQFKVRDVTLTGEDGGTTTFHIGKLFPMDAFRVLEKIRTALGVGMASVPAGQSTAASIVAVVLSLPEDRFTEVRNLLFSHVTFTDKNVQTPLHVAGMEEQAFANLDPLNIYEIFLRCVAVNFFQSFKGLLSRIGPMLQDILPQDTKTSTPSSLSP